MMHTLTSTRDFWVSAGDRSGSESHAAGVGAEVMAGTLADCLRTQQDQLDWLEAELQSRPGLTSDAVAFAQRVQATLSRQVQELRATNSPGGARENRDPRSGQNFVGTRPARQAVHDLREVRWLEKIYVELSALVIGYVVLHGAAQASSRTALCETSLRHLARLQDLVRELRQLLPALVTAAGAPR